MSHEFEPYWETKVWGRVQHIFADPHAAVSCLVIEKGYRCSVHRHIHRANLFAVQCGRIVVDTYDGDGVESVYLGPGDTYSVPSGVWHCFRVIESGSLTEVYWPDRGGEVRLDDIERRDVGGIDESYDLSVFFDKDEQAEI